MNISRKLTKKLVIMATLVLITSLVIALVAIPASAINQVLFEVNKGDLPSALEPVPMPTLINYQGYLTDSGGNPINDTLEITFSIYEVATEGTAVWTETHSSVIITDGWFNVLLGSVDPIFPLYLTGESYLGIKVGAELEMTPRQQIVSVAYALRAGVANYATNADKLDNLDSTEIDDLYVNETGPDQMSGADMVSTLTVNNTIGTAIDAITTSEQDHSAGIHGWAEASTGATRGVSGLANSPQGIGVYGQAPSVGVQGYAPLSSGYGVFGYSDDGTGVRGNSNTGTGVFGRNDSSGNYGRIGTSDEGVYGESTDIGVKGYSSGSGVGVYGETNGTWGMYTPDSLYVGQDIDVANNVEVGGEIIGDVSAGTITAANVEISGDLVVTGEAYGFFPQPAYDSDWYWQGAGTEQILTHNLGGNVDNYVVDLQFKDIETPGELPPFFGINILGHGLYNMWPESEDGNWGAYWHNLNENTIMVGRASSDYTADQIRVRIWVYNVIYD